MEIFPLVFFFFLIISIIDTSMIPTEFESPLFLCFVDAEVVHTSIVRAKFQIAFGQSDKVALLIHHS